MDWTQRMNKGNKVHRAPSTKLGILSMSLACM